MITIDNPSFRTHSRIEKNADVLKKCSGDGSYNYVKNSSRLDNLYDLIDVEDKIFLSNEKDAVLVVQESDKYSARPIYRAFGIGGKDNKRLLASFLGDSGGNFNVFDRTGKNVAALVENEESKKGSKSFCVGDDVLRAQVQDMGSMKKVDFFAPGAKIKNINYHGSFGGVHRNILANMLDYVEGILAGEKYADKLYIQSADNQVGIEEITPSRLEKTPELLERGKLDVTSSGSLKIKNGYLEGNVPLFEHSSELLSFEKDPFCIKPGLKWYSPDILIRNSAGGQFIVDGVPSALDKQARFFVRAVIKYLRELDKHMDTSSKIDYFSAVKKLLRK